MECRNCKTSTEIEDMPIKMGGLLCPECRTIIFQPYVDPEYFIELKRRNKEYEEKENARKTGQEGS